MKREVGQRAAGCSFDPREKKGVEEAMRIPPPFSFSTFALVILIIIFLCYTYISQAEPGHKDPCGLPLDIEMEGRTAAAVNLSWLQMQLWVATCKCR